MTLEALNKRIKTTTDLRGIVSTMKMLSSVSVGPYEKALVSLNQYGQTIDEAFIGLIVNGGFQQNLIKLSEKPRTIAILIGTDNGLVGRFNRDVVTKAHNYFKRKGYESGTVPYICIGKRMTMLGLSSKANVAASYPISNSVKELTSTAAEIMDKIQQIATQNHTERILIFANYKVNARVSPAMRQLLPLPQDHFTALKKQQWPGKAFPMISQDKHTLLKTLTQEYLSFMLSKALTASLAAEHYTRMMNMQQAEKNIDERLEVMNLEYQQARQTAITDELIDIVSGAESIQKQQKKCP